MVGTDRFSCSVDKKRKEKGRGEMGERRRKGMKLLGFKLLERERGGNTVKNRERNLKFI